MEPQDRLEDQPAPVGKEQRGGGLEFLRLPLLRRDEIAVACAQESCMEESAEPMVERDWCCTGSCVRRAISTTPSRLASPIMNEFSVSRCQRPASSNAPSLWTIFPYAK